MCKWRPRGRVERKSWREEQCGTRLGSGYRRVLETLRPAGVRMEMAGVCVWDKSYCRKRAGGRHKRRREKSGRRRTRRDTGGCGVEAISKVASE